jgi:hypothetical protein
VYGREQTSMQVSQKPGKRIMMAVSLVVGSIVALFGIYLACASVFFIHKAVAVEATIVESRRDFVPMGRGSALAYVPVIELPSTGERVRVDTHRENEPYIIGERLSVLCQAGVRCIPNTFLDKWGNALIDLGLSLLFFAPPIYYFRYSQESVVNSASPKSS